jgi:hypothetical protein
MCTSSTCHTIGYAQDGWYNWQSKGAFITGLQGDGTFWVSVLRPQGPQDATRMFQNVCYSNQQKSACRSSDQTNER